MIDPRSLRIGNRMIFIGTEMTCREMDVTPEDIAMATIHPEWFEHVILNERHLINMGFTYEYEEKYSHAMGLTITRNAYSLEDDGLDVFIVGFEDVDHLKDKKQPGVFIEGLPGVAIKSVHELQNLYYALKNRELIYNTKP